MPFFRDNYAYLVIDDRTNAAAIVDPGDAAPVLAAVTALGVELQAIWATHHHADHIGGIAALRAALPNLAVVASTYDAARIAGTTHAVADGETVTVGTLHAQVLATPGHTLGAVCYWLPALRAVCTGDTLFGAGCGRLFEGNAAQLHASLQRLAALPPETQVYFGHEYTASNLRFAQAILGADAGVQAAVADLARQHTPSGHGAAATRSTPSTIARECAANLFLRCAEPAVATAAGLPAHAVATAVFAELRARKDAFG